MGAGATVGRFAQRPTVRFAAAFLLAAAIVAARRYPQLQSPDVWVEDGTQVLDGFVKHGWWSLLMPVNGYLIVPAKLVSFAALGISFTRYALVSTILAVVAQAACTATVAVAPTHLPAKFLCALAVVLVPIGTEVFALPLYVFWWTTLFVFLAVLWRNGERPLLRIVLLAVGGVSSPMIILCLPLLAGRAVLERARGSIAAALVALVLSVVQGIFLLRQGPGGTTLASLREPFLIVAKYFGAPLYSFSFLMGALFGIATLAVLAWGLAALPQSERRGYCGMLLLVLLAVVSSLGRVPIEAPHPVLAGPRYFFYPVVMILWALLWLAARAPRQVSAIAAALVGMAVPSALLNFTGMSWTPERPWPDQVMACRSATASYTFDIQTGLDTLHWHETLEPQDCRRLADSALIN